MLIKNLEDNLTGIVSNGVKIYEYLQNPSMQRQMELKNSYIH
jgi:hypothetical protein